jgi:lipopolysaccharide export system permease protein
VRILGAYLVRSFLPVLLTALAFFILIIQLVDLFGNLVQYLNLNVSFRAIARVQLLFLPRALTFALPISLLFATGFTLGSLYSRNELIAVFGAGVPIWRFVAPLLVGGLLLSVGLFFFEEYVVIDTFRAKNEQTRQLLNISRSFSNTNVTVRDATGAHVYSAEYYNDQTNELSRVLILVRDRDDRFVRRIDANAGVWNGEYWEWRNGTEYAVQADGTIRARPFATLDDTVFRLSPQRFQRNARAIEEMRFDEAREWIVGLRDAGQPYRQQLTDYYERFSFSFTPFIVLMLASSLGGRFRKNILLMSLLISLVVAVVYYVTGMVAGIMASNGRIPPITGAWAATVLFASLGVILFRTART